MTETIKNILVSNENSQNKNTTLSEKSASRSVLEILAQAAEQNSQKLKQGHRHEAVIKLFASYIKMLGGTLLYETLY